VVAINTEDSGAVIVLSRDNQLQEISLPASYLIAKYFGISTTNCLPGVLKRWLDSLDIQGIHVCSPLIVPGERHRLLIRFCTYSTQILLYLTEECTVSRPELPHGLGLTPREKEVLVWVAMGKTNVEIGSIMSLSVRTVEKHLQNIFQKLGVETRTAAASRAWEYGSSTRVADAS